LVILELKFTNRFPVWFEDLVRSCNLVLTGAAKYVEGVAACGESLFYGRQPTLVEEMQATREPEVRQDDNVLLDPEPAPGVQAAEANILIKEELNHG